MRLKKFMVLIPALMLSGCAGGFGNNSFEKPPVVAAEEHPQYNVEQVRLTNMESTDIVYFTFRQAEETQYSFERAGRLGKVYFNTGDTVYKDDIIASLYGYEEAKQEYDSCSEEYETVSEKYEALSSEMDYMLREYEIKHKYGYMSDEEYNENTKAVHDKYDSTIRDYEDKLTLLELRISEAEKIVSDGCIYATATGVVSQIRNVYKSGKGDNDFWGWFDKNEDQAEGDYDELFNHVESTDVIATVANSGEPVFYCETEYASYFKPGDVYKLESGDRVYETYVKSSEGNTVMLTPVGDFETAYVGMSISYKLVLEEKPNVVVISQSALHKTGDDYYVYIVGDDNLRQMRSVEIGITNSQYVEILSGLELGDVVVKR